MIDDFRGEDDTVAVTFGAHKVRKNAESLVLRSSLQIGKSNCFILGMTSISRRYTKHMSVQYAFKHVDLEGLLDRQRCAWLLRGILATLMRHVAVSFFHVKIVY